MTLCKRTLCLWKPGQQVKGMYCYFVWKGDIPCTGTKRCMFCGEEEKDATQEIETAAAQARADNAAGGQAEDSA